MFFRYCSRFLPSSQSIIYFLVCTQIHLERNRPPSQEEINVLHFVCPTWILNVCPHLCVCLCHFSHAKFRYMYYVRLKEPSSIIPKSNQFYVYVVSHDVASAPVFHSDRVSLLQPLAAEWRVPAGTGPIPCQHLWAQSTLPGLDRRRKPVETVPGLDRWRQSAEEIIPPPAKTNGREIIMFDFRIY